MTNNVELAGRKASGVERAEMLLKLRDSVDIARKADLYVLKYVQDCRSAGVPWSQIGEVFGVSKSAAYQRFAHAPKVGYIK